MHFLIIQNSKFTIHDFFLFHVSQIPCSNIHEVSGNGGGSGHHGAYEMSPAAFPLASFEVAVGGAGGALPAWEHVGIHRDAHTASRVAPFEARITENPVQPFFFGL